MLNLWKIEIISRLHQNNKKIELKEKQQLNLQKQFYDLTIIYYLKVIIAKIKEIVKYKKTLTEIVKVFYLTKYLHYFSFGIYHLFYVL